ncbi:MAG: heparin lyase I family protein [Myxococcota bacterium]
MQNRSINLALVLLAAMAPFACAATDEASPVPVEGGRDQARSPRVVLESVVLDGGLVTLRFANHGLVVPEGGYEVAYGPSKDEIRRSGEEFPRLQSDETNLEMSFELDHAKDLWFAVLVRDSDGYYYTNGMRGSEATSDAPPDQPDPPPPPSSDEELPEAVTWIRTYDFERTTSISDGTLYDGDFAVWGDQPIELVDDPLAEDGHAVRMRLDRNDAIGQEGDNGASRAEIVLKAEAIDSEDLRSVFIENMGNAYAQYGATIAYEVRTRIGENYDFDPASSVDGLQDECNSLWEFKMDLYSGRHGRHRQDALIRNRMEARQHNVIFKAGNQAPERLSDGSWKYPKANDGATSRMEDREISGYTNWSIVAKWHFTEGFLRVYKDAELVYSRSDTNTVYNAVSDDDGSRWGPYFKFGAYDTCYKAGYPADKVGDYREVFFDRFRIGLLD